MRREVKGWGWEGRGGERKGKGRGEEEVSQERINHKNDPIASKEKAKLAKKVN